MDWNTYPQLIRVSTNTLLLQKLLAPVYKEGFWGKWDFKDITGVLTNC